MRLLARKMRGAWRSGRRRGTPVVVRLADGLDRYDDAVNPLVNEHRVSFRAVLIADWLIERLPCRHYVVNDHLRRPEYRYCLWCGRSRPYLKLDEP